MRPRYAVVDKTGREEFEREYQMPYGYSSSSIYFDLESAIRRKNQLANSDYDDYEYVIEEYDNGAVREIVL
jgi:hypothetical protein